MFKLVLEKAEESEIKLPTSAVSLKKQESSRKTSAFVLLWRRKWQPIPVLKKGNAKECSNYYTIVLISHVSKVMVKIVTVRLLDRKSVV